MEKIKVNQRFSYKNDKKELVFVEISKDEKDLKEVEKTIADKAVMSKYAEYVKELKTENKIQK